MSTKALSMMKAAGIYEDEAPRPTGFVENMAAAYRTFVNEDISTAETRSWQKPIEDSLNEIARVTGKAQYKPRFTVGQQGAKGMDLEENRRLLQAAEEDTDVRGARMQGRLTAKSYQDIAQEIEVQASLLRQRQEQTARYATGWGKVGEFGGYMGGAMTDPVNIAALPFGASAANLTSKSLLANMGRVFATEAAVGVAAETLIQPQVFSYKRMIDSPYTVLDAGVNVLAAGVGGGLFGSGTYGAAEGVKAVIRGPARSVRGQVDEAVDAGDILPDQDIEAAADVIDELDEMLTDVNPLDPSPRGDADHLAALQKASDDMAQDLDPDVEVLTTGTRPEAVDPLADALDESQWEIIQPHEMEIDADTFQFKSGGDEYGVTIALQGVTEWVDDFAGTAIVWERADGKRFIADGHQRSALAKRLIGEGYAKPGDIRMPARILREKDGVTAHEAMARASLKNIAEGTGDAVDAAKVMRSLNPKTRAMMPQLPPNKALVRDAKGLSRLGDDAFRMVIDDRLPGSYAAMVGDYFSDPGEQVAAITALQRAEPANRTQAEIMINQVRAAGFERQVTEDLFGERELVESLFKERARILDRAMHKIRQDKKTFQLLAERETEINGHGNNQLDTDANLARFSADQDALASLIADANMKGFVSDQLGKAAARLKGGSTLKKETETFLNKYRKNLNQKAQQDNARLMAKKGKPLFLKDLTRKEAERAEILFKEPQLGREDVDAAWQMADKAQTKLVKLGKSIEAEMEGRVFFSNPGTKKLDTVKDKLRRKQRTDAGKLTDIARAGFIADDFADVEAVIKKLGDKVELLVETVSPHPDTGYFDLKALVRFPDGTIAEMQFWSSHLLMAKEGMSMLRDGWKVPAKWLDGRESPEVPGHVYYEEIRGLPDYEKASPEQQARIDELNALSREIYGKAGQSAHTSWKSEAGMDLPSSLISKDDTGSQVAPTSSSLINQPPDEAIMAGRLPQDQYDLISDTGTGNAGNAINSTSKQIVNDFTQDDNQLFDIVDQMIADNPDMEIAVSIDATGEGEVAQTMKMSELFEELDAREQAINNTISCITGGAA